MMKIHTTQNLTSLGRMKSTNNDVIPNDEIRLNYSEQMRKRNILTDKPDSFDGGVSFRGKGNAVEHSKKIIEAVKKSVGEVAKEAKPERMKGDKFMDSPLFHSLLKVVDYENVAQAGMAAVVCTILRPATIMSLPTKKNKEDNIYASAHSVSSGLAGLATATLLTTPFKKGSNYVMDVMLKDLDVKVLKRLFPQLDKNSIVNSDGTRKAVSEWKDIAKNKFSKEYKDVAKLPQFKHLAEVSEQTFKDVLKVDADWAAQKGKSFNDVVLKDGSKLYDKIDMSRLGLVVKEDSINDAQILFKDLDKDYVKRLVEDAKGTRWGELNVDSVFDSTGKVVDFKQWKDKAGKEWKLDLDEVFVSSPFETANYRPRISGKKRLDERENKYKFATYQKNGVDDMLGTEITSDMVKAEATNEGLFKLITWLPDLAFRVPIAAGTIAMIPWILKHGFHLEKSSAKKANEVQKEAQAPQVAPAEEKVTEGNVVSFKGKGNPKKTGGWFSKFFAEQYGKRLIESEKVHNFSEKLSKVWGGPTQLLTTFGSLITSGVYVHQTLKNKDLDPQRRKTLGLNQALGFLVPTVAAYSVDKLVSNWTKNKEYRFSGLQERKIDMAKFEGNEKVAKEMAEGLGKKLKGVRLLTTLSVFTFIYRYATPVAITPLANWISNKIFANKNPEVIAEKK